MVSPRLCIMGRTDLVIAIACAASISLFSTHACCQEVDVAISDVIAGLEKTESAIQTLSVTLKSTSTRDFRPFGTDVVSSRSTLTEHWQLDAAGRGWNKAVGNLSETNRDGNIRQIEIDHHATFDGQTGRVITIEIYDNGSTARRGSLETSLIRRGVAPFDFVTQHRGQPVSAILQERNGRISGTQEWDGRMVMTVEVDPMKEDAEYKSEFWIDPHRGFVVVRRRNFIRITADQPWTLSSSIDGYNHDRVAGVWLPKLAWSRNFALPVGDATEGRLSHNYKAICSDWQVNVEIPNKQMTLTFPPGLKVRGMLEAFQANQTKLKNFFVEPVTTQLQRKLVRGQDVIAYASIDVTAFVDVNTHQITPARCDFEALKKRLKDIREATQQGTLYLHFDFGAIGTDQEMAMFVREPITAMCKQIGFANVRTSSTYHNDDKTWQPAEDVRVTQTEESNLGDDRVSIFPVRTRLSRWLTEGADCLIELNQSIPIDAKQLIDEEAMATIENALRKEAFDGTSVSAKIPIGGTNKPDPGADRLPHTQDDSDIQRAAVDFLRSLGFKDIRLTVSNGFTNYVSHFPIAESRP